LPPFLFFLYSFQRFVAFYFAQIVALFVFYWSFVSHVTRTREKKKEKRRGRNKKNEEDGKRRKRKNGKVRRIIEEQRKEENNNYKIKKQKEK